MEGGVAARVLRLGTAGLFTKGGPAAAPGRDAAKTYPAAETASAGGLLLLLLLWCLGAGDTPACTQPRRRVLDRSDDGILCTCQELNATVIDVLQDGKKDVRLEQVQEKEGETGVELA